MHFSFPSFLRAGLAAGALAAATVAHAAWPSDAPITITVGFAPGGATDVMVRTLAPFVAKHLGGNANLIIQNRPGASGEVAINTVMRAKPDGYSLVVVNLPGYFFVPMYRKSSYTMRDLTLLARVVSDPTIMVVRKDSKITDLKQVLAALKAKPNSISAGHNGVGTNGHLAMARLEGVAGVKFNGIPYNGTAQQKVALGSNTLDIAFLAASEIQDPETEATPVRLLAQFSKNKVQRIANVPTTFELGLPVEMTAERGLAAPNGVPAPIVARLEKAIQEAMKDPEYIKAAPNDAPFLSFLGGAEWTRQIDQDRKAYEAIARTVSKE
ncbi:tripartite tricarboxylate transporter substrate binding protein [Ramlibacter ginsenosidimutans]|uniref:Tripartite tricarboxylate transporter substrate binding protein n=1 Tax=Ramlibacter ginsenosidimutans TaxID=502333 RepID=A0A934TVT4_9BURK|nr:tripartite tricarboxylate transporter substrate binding protein [Ramlibacter ginsenosidimutans]MBK6007642.1 tripartite tricarboxylate transporter substrate binding protein [Ramlibacter ginsenosidimutans]